MEEIHSLEAAESFSGEVVKGESLVSSLRCFYARISWIRGCGRDEEHKQVVELENIGMTI